MTQSVWPHDHTLHDSAEKQLNELWCFVICPSNPPEYWNDLFSLVNSVCQEIAKSLGVQFRCRRAVDVVSAGIVHPEIWRDIRSADLVVADITGSNGNVMLELGVASAWLDKDRVIILREHNPGEPRLFDINPARQLDYRASPAGFQDLAARLAALVQDAIARAPFEQERPRELTLPAELDLSKEKDARVLWGPSGAHRRILDDRGLEFGSLYNFRYGWLSVGSLLVRNVRVCGEFCFSKTHDQPPYAPWMGIMLRSQGYFANMGHLALLRTDGKVARTELAAGQHKDIDIGEIKGFDAKSRDFVPFDVRIDERAWTINVGSAKHETLISALPEVFADGRIIIVSQFCWVGLRRLSVEPL